ncbi:MAG: hypothetical protein MUC50_03770, partial [Myxococcota bacterium]|nr:hypothetical protein [Myxococcota bacterium]
QGAPGGVCTNTDWGLQIPGALEGGACIFSDGQGHFFCGLVCHYEQGGQTYTGDCPLNTTCAVEDTQGICMPPA